MRDIARPEARGDDSLRIDLELAAPVTVQGTSGPATLTASTSARVFHARPVARPDRRRELANLYSPYWQARLAPSPLEAVP